MQVLCPRGDSLLGMNQPHSESVATHTYYKVVPCHMSTHERTPLPATCLALGLVLATRVLHHNHMSKLWARLHSCDEYHETPISHFVGLLAPSPPPPPPTHTHTHNWWTYTVRMLQLVMRFAGLLYILCHQSRGHMLVSHEGRSCVGVNEIHIVMWVEPLCTCMRAPTRGKLLMKFMTL